MRTKAFLICLPLVGIAAVLSSCSSENRIDADELQSTGQKGKVTLELKSGVEFATTTRAVDESSYQNTSNYNVEITDSRGNSKFSGTYATLQTRLPLELDLGSYSISANYGTEYAASRDGFLVTGNNTFTISTDNTVTTTVNCTPTAGKVFVEFDNAMNTYYDTYSVDFSGTEALGNSVAHWAKEDTAPYYLAIGENGETVTYTIYLTAKSEYATQKDGQKQVEATATGTFQLARNTAKKLSVKPNYTPTTDGGLAITITIDDSTNDQTINIEVPVTWIN